jgi:hypothetical protein
MSKPVEYASMFWSPLLALLSCTWQIRHSWIGLGSGRRHIQFVDDTSPEMTLIYVLKNKRKTEQVIS